MMKRRNFLQLTGSTLAALGMSHLDIINQGNRYAKVLAENTPRKLALLVGITEYPKIKRFEKQQLEGCVNDVRLQKELLVHRFGFCPDDIVTLTTKKDTPYEFKPTRKNILEKFEEHLIKQARPGDIVVFHFSGHGSHLRDPRPIKNCDDKKFLEFNSTLAVIDESQNNFAPDIMGRTLFLLRLALQKKGVTNVTMLLDSCFSGGGTRGNFVGRWASGDGYDPHPDEIAYQKRWIDDLKFKGEDAFKDLRCSSVGNGVVIASSEKDIQSWDGPIRDFSAGAFTYFLTQYLWQETNTLGKIITEIKSPIQSFASKQNPVVDGDDTQPIFFIDTKSIPPSEGVISSIKGEEINLWLGGVEYQSLPNMQKDAKFALSNNSGKVLGEIILTSPREFLDAKAKLVSKSANLNIQPGMLVQEISRVIPANLKLNIGLDPSLTKDISDAIKMLSQINRMEAITAQANTRYPRKLEYILGRMTKENRKKQTNREDLPDIDTIGLFSEALEFIPGSFGKQGESITDAVSRLKPKLTSFLAMRLLKQTLNANSSTLDVEASISLLEQPNTIIAQTQTAKSNQIQAKKTYSRVLPLNKLFQFEIKNNTTENLYVMVILIDVTGKPYVVFPYQNIIKNRTLQLKPNEPPLVIGKPDQIELKAVEKGSAEALIVTSRSELKNAAKMLQQLVRETRGGGRGEANKPIDISRGEPVAVIDDLLDDLSGSRSGSSQPREIKADNIATLSMSFEVG
ncbi:MAG: caspase family protein [Tolypothrix brevis GSE-NOS-MK-07-07A]|jgi:hypothetical protein|nr:caspase family protein [Tolypothrix brevis GSE-NOS-MK-07-07A]